MFDAYIDTLNSTLAFSEALERRQDDILNLHTFGYKEKGKRFIDTDFGVVFDETQNKMQDIVPHVFMKGENMTKMAINRDFPSVFFVTKKGDQEFLTRLGNFKYTRKQREKDTYIGKPLEERVYLTTQDGYNVMGYPIGKGPLKQEKRFKDPFSDIEHPRLGDSPIKTDEKEIGKNQPMEYGPMVPIDLTRGENGLILDKYTKVKTGKDGIIRGFKDGLWVPLYKISMGSVPNPEGLAQVKNTAYMIETEESGLRKDAPKGVTIMPEAIERSNVNTKLASYDYKKYKFNMTVALSLQKSNMQLLQQFQQLLQ